MDTRSRRKITQTTGARVIVSDNGEAGVVVGHYDDDSVFVLFDGADDSERVWVSALTLETP